MHTVPFEQLKQFAGHELQFPLEEYWPGGHLVQFEAESEHSMQGDAQDSQLEVELRNNPTWHEPQILMSASLQVRHPGAHAWQTEDPAALKKPGKQRVHWQFMQPGGQI